MSLSFLPAVAVPDLSHFLRLVHDAHNANAPVGETAAREIAQVIVDQVHLLDRQALSGLHLFIDFTRMFPTAAAEFMDV